VKSLGLQVAEMAKRFPDLRFERSMMSWYGNLQPDDDATLYRIKITYCPPNPPKVWVRRPSLHPEVKHRYSDGTLCLYDPREGEWDHSMLVSQTIVPWTAEWLLYYEAWLIDPEKRWFGPEAPHGRRKLSRR